MVTVSVDSYVISIHVHQFGLMIGKCDQCVCVPILIGNTLGTRNLVTTDRPTALQCHCIQFRQQTFSSKSKIVMSFCAVLCCGNYFRKTKNVSYHRLTRHGEIRNKWRSFFVMKFNTTPLVEAEHSRCQSATPYPVISRWWVVIPDSTRILPGIPSRSLRSPVELPCAHSVIKSGYLYR